METFLYCGLTLLYTMTDEKMAKERAKRLMKKVSGKRVSDKAVDELVYELDKFAEDLILKANDFSDHADRKTIKKKDVLAVR